VGGYDRRNYLDDVTEYGEEGIIRELPKLRTARHSAACGATGQLLVVAGGIEDFSPTPPLDTVELLRDYRTATSWVVATARLPRAVHGARMTLLGTDLYLTGGFDSSYNRRTEILRFRPVEEDWLEVGNLVNGRSYHGQVAIANPASYCTGQRNISPGSEETAALG